MYAEADFSGSLCKDEHGYEWSILALISGAALLKLPQMATGI